MNKLKTLWYVLKLTVRLTPSFIYKIIGESVFKSISPFLNIIIMKYIIDELMGSQNQELLVTYVVILVAGNFILRVVNMFFTVSLNITMREVHNNFGTYLGEKCTDIDFEHIEDVEILNLKEKAYFAIFNLNIVGQTIEKFSNIIYSIFVISGLTYLLFVLNPLLIIGLLAIVLINALIFRHMSTLMYKVEQNAISGNRAYMYYLNLSKDFSIAKDIRLYQGSSMLVGRIKKFTDSLVARYASVYTKQGILTGYTKINIQLQMVLIYVYLAYSVMNNNISIGDLTMYAGAVSTFSVTLSSVIESILQIDVNCSHLANFEAFDKLTSKVDEGKETTDAIHHTTIVFDQVSFKYPRKEEWVLEDVSITIKPGEKLSIVGLNGAGKTTFIKLLSRLYQPTKGKITVGGVDINLIDYQEYMELIGVVFQDFKLLSYTIKENLTNNWVDEERINDCLQKAGFDKDLSVLDKGVETCVYKNFDKTGIEFSGGQLQKLALARTLYKDSPIVILDEPTSALDPISEYEVYNNFNNMVDGKTAIYISHRLSSTRFSDRIAVFNQGKIVEYGCHKDLIDKGNLYKKMYETQANYYV